VPACDRVALTGFFAFVFLVGAIGAIVSPESTINEDDVGDVEHENAPVACVSGDNSARRKRALRMGCD
jgi:hypothetical protein